MIVIRAHIFQIYDVNSQEETYNSYMCYANQIRLTNINVHRKYVFVLLIRINHWEMKFNGRKCKMKCPIHAITNVFSLLESDRNIPILFILIISVIALNIPPLYGCNMADRA